MQLRLKRVLPVALLVLMLAGCSSGGSTTTINSMDAKYEAGLKDAVRLSELKLSREEELERHYGKGLYYVDFKKEEDEINIKFAEKFEAVYKSKITNLDYPIHAVANMEIMNDSLQKYRDGEITFEDIYENQVIHVRRAMTRYYLFGDLSIKEGFSAEDNYELLASSFTDIAGGLPYIDTFIADEKYKSSIYEMPQMDYKEMAIYLDERNIDFDALIINGNGYHNSNFDDDVLSRLQEKYDEEFIFIKIDDDPNVDGFNDMNALCIPKRDPEIEFYAHTMRDKYFSTLTQGIIGKRMNEIIDEFGLSDRVVQFTFYESMDEFDDEDERLIGKIDTDAIVDPLEFVQQNRNGDYETTFFYLVEPGESEDTELLENLVDEAFFSTKDDHGEALLVPDAQVFQVSKENRRIIVDVFRNEIYAENYFRQGISSVSEALATYLIDRGDTEGFLLLEVFGEMIKD
ncbi:hypothetical protein [Fusibacter sp. JL216-2]|uniref:hypothetical protein n=1 Tax=Fusibacter sp. JL216-2 TaxID=3071453 RepID=UPI003D3409E4